MSRHPVAPLPPEIARSISKEDLADVPMGRYEGPVRLVESPDDLEVAIEEIVRERVVGFDTETRPAFRVGESYLPSLVQLATAQAVYLFQIQQLDCSTLVRAVMSSERIVKAGVSVADDVRKLKRVIPFDAQGVVDLGHVARRHGLAQTGVRNLAAIFLGTRIPKGAKTTNWAAPTLTRQQIGYAATDAWVCRELYLRFEGLGLVGH